MKFRIEEDSLGKVRVPRNALWGAQTQRAIDNFPISGISMNFPFTNTFIAMLGYVKDAAARANKNLKLLEAKKQKVISRAAKEVWTNKHGKEFPIDVFQTGSGTSTNMNANEVIANLCYKTSKVKIHPNDDVNMSQSSNLADVIPTVMNLAYYFDSTKKLMPALNLLIETLEKKAESVKGITKTGRTHLMDAMPVDMSDELNAWNTQLKCSRESISVVLEKLLFLPQGGTAVGSGINAHRRFSKEFAKELSKLTGFKTKPSKDFFRNLSAQDLSVQLSGELKNLATILLKISNDLRWMNSGPLSGISEIELQALQPGSSIMPGKVNPVIPEAVAMAAADVIGNDVSITVAAQSGNFQLNVMLPVIAYCNLKSVNILAGSMNVLAKKAIKTFKVNHKKIEESLSRNPILVTALNPVIGYQKAAEIAKRAYKESRPVIDVAHEETGISVSRLKKLLDPSKLTKGGIKS
ncbi:MAG: fumarate hydratase class II [Gammaproteobacteria bacterium]|nr:MAG: fumarate hydratase class II [Gammaproteobacteria bacterium]